MKRQTTIRGYAMLMVIILMAIASVLALLLTAAAASLYAQIMTDVDEDFQDEVYVNSVMDTLETELLDTSSPLNRDIYEKISGMEWTYYRADARGHGIETVRSFVVALDGTPEAEDCQSVRVQMYWEPESDAAYQNSDYRELVVVVSCQTRTGEYAMACRFQRYLESTHDDESGVPVYDWYGEWKTLWREEAPAFLTSRQEEGV